MQHTPAILNDQKTVIIIGMHRSGTSLIANWLNKCGLNIGEKLLAGATGNIEGHFEDVDFNNIHIEILKNNGLPDSGMIIGDALKVKKCYLKQIGDLIEKKKVNNEIWGWKDPRTCLFLDVYRELLPNALHLTIIRDYQSVVISLLKRSFINEVEGNRNKKNFFSKLSWRLFKRRYKFKKFCVEHSAFFLNVWINYNQKILENIRTNSSKKLLVIDYKLLNENDSEVISYLNEKWKLSLNYFEFARVYKEELMSAKFNVEDFISDKSLLRCAGVLQSQLNRYIGINNAINSHTV